MPNDKVKEEYSYPLYVNMQFFFCGVPFRLDTYSGCSHNCRYCFARNAENFNQEKQINKGNIRPADVASIRKMFVKALDWNRKYEDINVEFIRQRVPLHWGGMSDPFQPIEKQLKISWKAMELFNWYQYPAVISTKGELVGDDEYIAMLKDGKYAVQITLISSNDKMIGLIEPGAPSASKRLAIMEKLSKAGLWVACRIQPVIVASPVEDKLAEHIKNLADVGVKHIVVEGLKIPLQLDKDWKTELNVACGGNVYREYESCGAKVDGQEIILPSWRKWQYLEVALEVAHKYGMTVGAADNDLRDFGDVKCCCGIDNLPGFENYWKLQSATVSEVARKNGICRAEDLDKEWSGESTFKFQKSTIAKQINGVQVSYPIRHYWNEVWALKDPRSPSYLVNLDQVYNDGKVCYVFKDKGEQLRAARRTQATMF